MEYDNKPTGMALGLTELVGPGGDSNQQIDVESTRKGAHRCCERDCGEEPAASGLGSGKAFLKGVVPVDTGGVRRTPGSKG